MNRLGAGIALLLVILLVAFATMVHVTGPGWTGHAEEGGTGPDVARAPAPVAASMVMPVQGAELRDNWNEKRGHGMRAHQGIDIMAPTGTPVRAVADGKIEKLFESRRGGLTVYERSADGGVVYYYAHLDAYAPGLAEGQAVRAGQAIATVGSTGNADPGAPHLHFEVHRMAAGEGWWQGRAVDPYPLLKAVRG